MGRIVAASIMGVCMGLLGLSANKLAWRVLRANKKKAAKAEERAVATETRAIAAETRAEYQYRADQFRSAAAEARAVENHSWECDLSG